MTLDQIITIRRVTQTQQADGSLASVNTDSQAYAAVYPMRGDERRMGNQQEAQADYRFHVINGTDLRMTDVILWNGYEFNVRFIADKGPQPPYLMFEAQRGVAV